MQVVFAATRRRKPSLRKGDSSDTWYSMTVAEAYRKTSLVVVLYDIFGNLLLSKRNSVCVVVACHQPTTQAASRCLQHAFISNRGGFGVHVHAPSGDKRRHWVCSLGLEKEVVCKRRLEQK